MKKIKVHNKIVEEAKEREKRWNELRGFMDKYQEAKYKPKTHKLEKPLEKTAEKQENEVDKFLKDIGLEKYSKVMMDNGIDDLEILQEVNETHLEQLGIVLGHRIKILKKIKEINEPEEKKQTHANKNLSPANYKNSPARKESYTQKEYKNTSKVVENNPDPVLNQDKSIETITGSESLYTHKSNQSNPLKISENPSAASLKVNSYTEREFRAPAYPKKQTEVSQNDSSRNKSPIVTLTKAPVSSKPITVGKSINTYEPESKEAEKEIKLSAIIETKKETPSSVDIKWDNFAYTPYKPSEEVQAAITNKNRSRPNSATIRLDVKQPDKTTATPADKFDVIGWNQ
jgi:SAM domain (Sterile alpha motif)